MELRSFSPVLRGEPRHSAWVIIFGGFSFKFLKTRPALSATTLKKDIITSPRANLPVASRVMPAISSCSTFLFTRVYASTIARRIRMCVCRKTVRITRKLPVPQIQMSNLWAWDNRSSTCLSYKYIRRERSILTLSILTFLAC